MRLAILGGSFNPVHVGHLVLADFVLSLLNYDRVILVPAFQSPFKSANEGASVRDRIDMLTASIPGDPRFAIEDCEINREGLSYTIDTLKDIIARYMPEGKPGLIMGDDLLSTFHNWRSPAEIADMADLIIARREAGSIDLKTFPYPHRIIDNEIINVSSSQIRNKIARGEAWRYLLPNGARHIIEERLLYGFTPDNFESGEVNDFNTIMHLENEVRRILSPKRFIHSKNTALLALDMARRLGLDCQKAYLAGITHDICKEHEEKELVRLATQDGSNVSKLEKKKPGLLHARAGTALLKKKYGINDKEILEAVYCHTTGQEEMSSLAKIVYIADKIEPSRPDVDSELRKMSRSLELDSIFRAVFDNTVAQLRARDLDLSYGTKRLLLAMEKRSKP